MIKILFIGTAWYLRASGVSCAPLNSCSLQRSIPDSYLQTLQTLQLWKDKTHGTHQLVGWLSHCLRELCIPSGARFRFGPPRRRFNIVKQRGGPSIILKVGNTASMSMCMSNSLATKAN